MNYFNNNKRWAIIVVLLIVLNAATLTIFWLERNGNMALLPSKNNKGGARAYLSKELVFDSLQLIQYYKLVTEHRQSSSEIRSQIREAKDSFFELISDTTATNDAITKAAMHTAETEQQLDLLTFNHFKSVRAICNSEQKKKFDSVIKNAVRMMGPSQQQRQRMPPKDGDHNRPPLDDENARPDGPPHDGDHTRPPLKK